MQPGEDGIPDYRREYDDDHDAAAERSAQRSMFPANELQLPAKDSRFWGGQRPFINAVHAKIIVEDRGQSLADLAGDLTIRQIKEQPYAHSHWRWTGAKEKDGRPVLRIHTRKKQARRVLWALYRGGAPDTRKVVHVTCGQRECVNPLHTALMWKGSWQRADRNEHQ